jgi:hypothetical protein
MLGTASGKNFDLPWDFPGRKKCRADEQNPG